MADRHSRVGETLRPDVECVVMLHGKPKEARWRNPDLPPPHMDNFFPWASKQLLLKGVDVWTPAVAEPHLARYEDFTAPLDVLQKLFDRRCVAVGSSFGGWVLACRLSEQKKIELNKLVLVDPWGDPEGNYDDGNARTLQIDPTLAERVGEIVIFWSSDDYNPEVDRTIEIIEGILPVRKRDLPGYGHFMIGSAMKGPEFPELIEEILR